MRRRPFAILSALSLLLCVAVVVLWVRSYDPGDHVRYYNAGNHSDFGAESSGGLLRVGWGEFYSRSYPPLPGWDLSFWAPDGTYYSFQADLWRGTKLGFRYDRWRQHDAELRINARSVTLPYWSLVSASAILPLVAFSRRARQRRERRRRLAVGFCPACGYDLRATPERCPECGMASKGVKLC